MRTESRKAKYDNFREAQSRVEHGAPDAKRFYDLAWHYRSGSGVEKDGLEAYYFFRRAAEMGLAEAQSILGSIYSFDNEIPKNQKKATHWFLKASKHGDMTAMLNLGTAYKTGAGIAQDNIKAVDCFKKAAQEHEAFSDLRESALYSLGQMYRSGLGVTKSNESAYVLWSEAASYNFLPAIDGLKLLKQDMNEQQRANAQNVSFKSLISN